MTLSVVFIAFIARMTRTSVTSHQLAAAADLDREDADPWTDPGGSGSDQRNLIISLRKATQARPKTRLNRLSARKIVTS